MSGEKIRGIVEKMIKFPDDISDVLATTDPFLSGEEYSFKYPKDKYQWSVLLDDSGDFILYFYPNEDDKGLYLKFNEGDFSHSGRTLLLDLFSLLKMKRFNFDKVAKDILDEF